MGAVIVPSDVHDFDRPVCTSLQPFFQKIFDRLLNKPNDSAPAQDHRGSDSGRRSESHHSQNVAAPAATMVADEQCSDSSSESNGSGDTGGADSGDGGSGDEGSGDDGDGEPPTRASTLYLPVALICAVFLLLWANSLLGPRLDKLWSIHGAAGGLVRVLYLNRKPRSMRQSLGHFAFFIIGGGLAAEHLVVELFAGARETHLFVVGYAWPTVLSLDRRKVKRILDVLLS